MYEMKRTVNCSQIGSHGIIRNSCLVDLLQDCSVIHLDTHPVMSPFFEKENCVMFLVSRQLDIVRRPEQNEKLTVKRHMSLKECMATETQLYMTKTVISA